MNERKKKEKETKRLIKRSPKKKNEKGKERK
jgi:hypothetical protein